jgi:mycothiol S-conjugate amidase
VLIGYGRDRVYAHPDHVRVHEITVLAFERAGDPDWYPELGTPWQPLKLYYTSGFTRERISSMHEWFVEQGEESPFTKWIERIESEAARDAADDRPTTRIDVRDHLDVARDALLAHHTQVPSDSFFFRVPLEVTQERHPWEEYVLARTLVDPGTADGEYETDLFAGLRVAASS